MVQFKSKAVVVLQRYFITSPRTSTLREKSVGFGNCKLSLFLRDLFFSKFCNLNNLRNLRDVLDTNTYFFFKIIVHIQLYLLTLGVYVCLPVILST